MCYMATRYQRGAGRERKYAERLRSLGWVVIRAAGSHGESDLVALRGGRICLIQVKSDSRGPFAHFGPESRKLLLSDANRAGGEAWLVHWPIGVKHPEAIPPQGWPRQTQACVPGDPPHTS